MKCGIHETLGFYFRPNICQAIMASCAIMSCMTSRSLLRYIAIAWFKIVGIFGIFSYGSTVAHWW